MISHIIAGVYFHEDIVEGSKTAALWALLMFIPFLVFRRKELFRSTANVFVGLAGLFVVFTFIKGAACPHYWEIALPFFLALGALALGIARFKTEGGFDRSLGWYTVFIFCAGILWGVAWISDISRVITGNQTTRAEFQARMIERSEQVGADQPATAPESKPEGDSKPQPESEERSQ